MAGVGTETCGTAMDAGTADAGAALALLLEEAAAAAVPVAATVGWVVPLVAVGIEIESVCARDDDSGDCEVVSFFTGAGGVDGFCAGVSAAVAVDAGAAVFSGIGGAVATDATEGVGPAAGEGEEAFVGGVSRTTGFGSCAMADDAGVVPSGIFFDSTLGLSGYR